MALLTCSSIAIVILAKIHLCSGVDDYARIKQDVIDVRAELTAVDEKSNDRVHKLWETQKILDAALAQIKQLQADKWGPELAEAKRALEYDKRKIRRLEDLTKVRDLSQN